LDRSSFVILIVDDDELVKGTIANLVRTFGYTTLEASSSEEALEIIKKEKVDIVITDIVMPGMNGLELLQVIWKSDNDIDVIVMTGYVDKSNYVAAVAAGAIDFLTKPIAQKELDIKLERACRERHLMRQLSLVAGKDELTGLFDYTAFTGHFPRELERAGRQKHPLHLAILELNDDDPAHMPELAEIVQLCIRKEIDKGFRFGEKEIAVLLPETTTDQAAEIVQRLLLVTLEREMTGMASLAIGLVSCELPEGADCDEVAAATVKKAQKAVADSRADGGGSVVIWT